MCVNKEVSLILFIMGVLTTIKLIYKGYTNPKLFNIYILTAVFVFTVSIMQLLEYILWINQECNQTNTIISYLIPLTLIIQPISYFLTADYLGTIKKYRLLLYFFSILLFVLFLVNVLYIYPNLENKLCSLKDEKSCRLEWNSITESWDHSKILVVTVGVLYFLIYLFVSLGYKGSKIQYKNKMIGNFINYSVILAFISSLIYSFSTNKNNIISINGSFFCFLVIIIVIIV